VHPVMEKPGLVHYLLIKFISCGMISLLPQCGVIGQASMVSNYLVPLYPMSVLQ